jgi:hypothetical protein
MEQNNEMNNQFTPAEYFEMVKGRKQKIDDEALQKIYDNCLELLNKYNITGQTQAMRKLMFHLDNIERERELVKMGIDTFVYKSDIEDFIRNVRDRVVKVDDLKDYEREIPDEITEVVAKTKHIFNYMYVVYTDYTGETERKVETHRRATDPILFGSFQDRKNGVVVERFYFLGDWEDAYCDLTLDKMVAEVRGRTGRDIVKTIKTPEDINELRAQLENLKSKNDMFVQEKRTAKKPNMFKRIMTAIKG